MSIVKPIQQRPHGPSMSVLFLDIDGVLVHEPPFMEPDQKCVERLNRITDETGAWIVLSSSWREPEKPTYAETLLHGWGVTGRVAGQTPRLECRLESGLWLATERGDEIRSWLLDNQHVGAFVILDDDSDMGALRERLVKTEFREGLTDGKADQCIAMLTKQKPPP